VQQCSVDLQLRVARLQAFLSEPALLAALLDAALPVAPQLPSVA